MNKAKQLGLSLLTLGAVASTQAQQVVKNVQGNIVKHLALGNGTSLPTITGNNNISVVDSDEGGAISVRTPNNISTGMNASLYTATTLPSEAIGNNTITRQTASQQQNTWTTQPNPDVSLSFTRKRARTDTNGDGGIDGIITIRDFPTLQTTLAPIPVNTKVRLISPSLTDLATGGTLLPVKDGRYNRDGNSRVAMTVRPDGSIPPILEDRGVFMGIHDFNGFGKATIYPNPSTGPLTIKTNNFNDKKVEIYNLSGQIVARMPISGDTSEIDISQLSTGPYIITTEDSDGNKTVNKIIKK